MIYFYGVKYKKKITDYSPFFNDLESSLNWYNEFGVKLEKTFNRVLIPTSKKR